MGGFKYVANVYGKNLRKQKQEPLYELSENIPLQAQQNSIMSQPGSLKLGFRGLRKRKYINK